MITASTPTANAPSGQDQPQRSRCRHAHRGYPGPAPLSSGPDRVAKTLRLTPPPAGRWPAPASCADAGTVGSTTPSTWRRSDPADIRWQPPSSSSARRSAGTLAGVPYLTALPPGQAGMPGGLPTTAYPPGGLRWLAAQHAAPVWQLHGRERARQIARNARSGYVVQLVRICCWAQACRRGCSVPGRAIWQFWRAVAARSWLIWARPGSCP